METDDVLQRELPDKQKWNWKKTVLVILGSVLILIVGALLYLNSYVNKSLPQHEGTINLPMLEQEVVVLTDEDGVPHIKAENDRDLFIAQGYIQAQSRLFQMDMSRRQASGRLSEVAGEAAVNTDKYFRTLGLRRAAVKSYNIASDEAKDVMGWFADGVNAYIDEAAETSRLPIEFTLMGSEPELWTPIDSFTIAKYMAFDLGGHWERQAFNYYLLNEYDEEKAYELFPTYPENKPTIIQDDEIDIAQSFEHAIIPPPFNGSNNWVVSGEKSASDFPLLADDPHLGLATPSIWYEMHLESDELNVSGVIFAGIPGIILGHNEHIAWGVTNVGPDVQQLYIEKRNPDNEAEFLFEGEWEQADIIDEPIVVKGEETISFQVMETRHGPVVSEFAEDSGKNTVLSLRWTALEATTEAQAILDFARATNWEEFEKGLESFLSPAQNFVFAAKDGTIAYKANGNIPIYENSDDALLPLPGWLEEHEWAGYIPFDELPRVVNPEKEFIATANNKVVGDDYPYHISNVWAQPYRYERIAEELESGDNFTVEHMKDLQMDTMNLRAREFVPLFLDTVQNATLSKEEQEAIELLEQWDYDDHVNEAQPLIFHHWMNEIEALLYEDIPENMMDLFSGRAQTADELLRTAINGDNSIWMDEKGGVEIVLHDSLTSVLTHLEKEFGADQTAWEWGDYHKVQFYHILSGIHPVLDYFLQKEKPMPVGGSGVTPMAASYDVETGEVNHGASWRFVIDTSDLNTGYHIVGPGQIGHFKSEWYDDQMHDWVNGTFHETKLDEQEGKQLILSP